MSRGRIAFYLTYAAIYGGFILSSSAAPPILGPYSLSYLAFLLVMASVFLAPTALDLLTKTYGTKDVGFSFILVAIGLDLAYQIAAFAYYQSRQYPFDPFLQLPPAIHVPAVGRGLQTASSVVEETRIACLGGSTTANRTLPEPERYPARLETILNLGGQGWRARVLNAGREWYTSKHSLINYVTNVRDAKPHVVIIMHAINDLYRSCTPRRFTSGSYKSDWSHYYGAAARAADPPSFERFLYERLLADAVSRWYGWFRVWQFQEVDYGLEYFRSLPDFEKSMRRLIEIVVRDGTIPVLVTQPSIYKEEMAPGELNTLVIAPTHCETHDSLLVRKSPSPGAMAKAMDAFNDVTRRLAREYGVLLVDAAPLVPKDLEHFTDDVHYTSAGSRRLAEVVAASLASSDVLERVRRRR